jgi:hypothetical protein
MNATEAAELLRESPDVDPALTEAAAARIRERLVLPTAGPGDVVRLSGIWNGDCHAHVVELVTRGVVVRVVGVLMLACGTWRRDHAAVFDVTSIEPWKIPTPRAPRAPRRPREART